MRLVTGLRVHYTGALVLLEWNIPNGEFQMKSFALIILISLSSQIRAVELCPAREQARMEMSAHSANIVNVLTTRTPAGGPYAYQKVVCNIGLCRIETEARIKKVFDRDHPDANEEGYVLFPDIDVQSEQTEINFATAKYEKAVRTCGLAQ